MHSFERGCGKASYEVADDGIVHGRLTGLIVPANAGALSAVLLGAGLDRSVSGVLGSVQTALIALPPIEPQHYAYVPAALRGVPVAVLVAPQQMAVYEGMAQAAAAAGTIRRAFLSREEAVAWLREQARALAANRVWRPERRPLP